MTHTCHAHDCERPVRPEMFMCRRHWSKVPKRLKNAIWGAYRAGQEADKKPSDAYLANASQAVKVVAAKEGKPLRRTSYDVLLEARQRQAGELLL